MLLSFFLLLLAQDVAQPGQNTVAVDLPAAIQLAQQGRDAEALAALQKIAAADPNDHLTRMWIASGEGASQGALRRSTDGGATWSAILTGGVGFCSPQCFYDIAIAAHPTLDALRRAEELAPQNPGVWAALASGYQLSGDTRQSMEYRQRLATASPTVVNRMDLENARREHGHRFESQTFGETYNGRTPTTRGSDLALNYRVSETFRVIAPGQLQRKFDRNEHRFGGGAEWRWTPWGTVSGQVLVNDGNRVLPQRDYMGRVDYGYHRATYTGTLRYFDFFGANVMMFSPAATVAVTPRWTFAGRYAFTTTDTAAVSGVESHTVEVRGAHEIVPRVWARGGYISGIENFDQFSIDHIGEFRAKTANASVQILLPSLTSIVGSYDYQWRKSGVHMGRISVSLVQAF